MKTSACAKNRIWIALCASVFAVGSAAAASWANPELVAKVASGELTEAKVSWWGYDAADATDYLQAALSSKAKKVTIDAPMGTWYTRPLRGRSNLELVIPRGVTLMAKRGEYKRQGDTLLTFRMADNVKLTGGGELKMWFEDYTNKTIYGWSEWRHELSLLSASHVTVENLTLSDSGGDGIYLGNANGNPNTDIVLRDLTITRHNRQAISVITADRLLIERCVLADTCGTPPMAGIDFEPNSAQEMLRDIVVRDTVARGNHGCGFDFSVFQLSAESPDISITLENCTSVGNRQPTKFSKPSDTINGFRGCVTFRNCTFDDGERSCVNLKSNSASETMALKVENCRARDYAKGGELAPMTGVWGWASVPKPTWPDGAPIRMLPTSAETLVTAKVHDDKPGEVVPLTAPAVRGRGDFFIYAAQKGRVRLKGKVLPVGRAPFKDAALFVNTMKGRRLKRVEGPTTFRQETDCSFDVPAPGFYHIDVRVGRHHGFVFTETDVPIALGPYGKAKFPGLNCGGGTLYLRVPEGASRLAVAATGGGGVELVHAQVYDGTGVCVLDRDNCSSDVYFSSGTPAPGLWKLVASRPSKGCLDDYAFGTYSHPCYLFLSPMKTWEIPAVK